MEFKILDKNVSTTMNAFIIIANIINIIYNIPQMMKTYKTKSTRDFSATFLFLRIIGNSIWIGYSIEIDSLMMLINNLVTVFASLFIGYYKVIELYSDYKQKKLCSDEIPLNNAEDDNDEKIIITD
jgi:MtN3 and saliva related transmembrane protein